MNQTPMNPTPMNRAPVSRAVGWQRLEGAVIFLAGVALCLAPSVAPHAGLPVQGSGGAAAMLSWWQGVLLFFAPDLSFLAYLGGPRIGARGYNLVHIYAFGAAVLAVGVWLASPFLAGCGALWLAHCGFDRMLGYGLKLPEGFGFTHLGPIGKQRG